MSLSRVALPIMVVFAFLGGCSKTGDAAPQTKADQPKAAEAPPQKTGLKFDSKRLKFVQGMLLDDLIHSAQEDTALTEKSEALRRLNITDSVEAKALAKDYLENEAKADRKYKAHGGRILISGTVESISDGFKEGLPYFASLRGYGALKSIFIKSNGDATGASSSLKRGRKAFFVCTIENHSADQVVASCSTLEQYAKSPEVRASYDQYVASLLSGKKQVVNEGFLKVFLTCYAVSKRLPDDSPCFVELDDACDRQLNRIGNVDLSPEEDAEIEEIIRNNISFDEPAKLK
ncbi:MAG: OB-fold putative lipoprotein [Proteobacteria bacterium]|nr:OB-fold putative lipoprotein [Pseudomonadota bacterium]MCL2310399.1 OB-fold putative lipoprotein [Pseudomonadota bacterium]